MGDSGVTQIAAFDYDDTIIDGQSGLLLGVYLKRRHLLTVSLALRLVWWGIRYKLKLPHRQATARELVFASLKHRTPERVRAFLNQFHGEVLVPRIRHDAVAEIERRRREGCFLLIVSASFSCIIEPACELLGVDAYVATHMEVDGAGAYTGRVDGEVTEGPGKASGIKAFADARFGEGRWELAYAYGDHHSDEEMLQMAAHAYAVDADSGLTRAARAHGWELLDWQ